MKVIDRKTKKQWGAIVKLENGDYRSSWHNGVGGAAVIVKAENIDKHIKYIEGLGNKIVK